MNRTKCKKNRKKIQKAFPLKQYKHENHVDLLAQNIQWMQFINECKKVTVTWEYNILISKILQSAPPNNTQT